MVQGGVEWTMKLLGIIIPGFTPSRAKKKKRKKKISKDALQEMSGKRSKADAENKGNQINPGLSTFDLVSKLCVHLTCREKSRLTRSTGRE